jgi:hypothetical protein
LKKPGIGQALQAGSFLLCAVLALHVTSGLGEPEFGGGWLTGRLLSMADDGSLLFIVALALTFFFERIAAAMGIASSLLCLPLYCFFIAPVPFAQAFARGHEFVPPLTAGFHWHTWPVTALLTICAAIYFCIRTLASRRMQSQQVA